MDTKENRRALMSAIEKEAFERRITMRSLFDRADVAHSILRTWRKHNTPPLIHTIGKLEAALATHKETE